MKKIGFVIASALLCAVMLAATELNQNRPVGLLLVVLLAVASGSRIIF